MEWRVPLSDIDFGAKEEQAVLDVIRSRWLTMGAVTQQFEQEFAEYVHCKHAIAVTNATAAGTAIAGRRGELGALMR